MERDPVCGMTVDPARATAQAIYVGKIHYFCCGGCADKFREEPAKYLGAKVSQEMPRDNALVQFSRAGAPAAAPALAGSHEALRNTERADTKRAAASAYVCPMDPEVREDFPGPSGRRKHSPRLV